MTLLFHESGQYAKKGRNSIEGVWGNWVVMGNKNVCVYIDILYNVRITATNSTIFDEILNLLCK